MYFYLRCDKCGYNNHITSEYLVYCSKCKTHLTNNYIEWVGKNPSKNFDDFKELVCNTEGNTDDFNEERYKKPENYVVENNVTSKRPRRKLTKAQWAGIIVGAIMAVVFTQIGKKVVTNLMQSVALNQIENVEFAPADTTNWKRFEVAEANIEILFPGDPTENKQTVDTDIGQLELIQYIFTPKIGKDANILYGIGYTNYSSQYVDNERMTKEELSSFFENSINGTLANVDGKLMSVVNINYGDYPGKEYAIDFKEGMAIIKMRSYLVKNRLYIEQVIIPAKNNFNKSIDYFLNSFRITGKEGGTQKRL